MKTEKEIKTELELVLDYIADAKLSGSGDSRLIEDMKRTADALKWVLE